MKNPFKEMYQQDKALLLTWGIGSGVGGYSGVKPPEFLQIVTAEHVDFMTNLIHLGWAAITAVVATTVSFLVTRLWKKIFHVKQ